MNARWLGIIFMATSVGVLLHNYRPNVQPGDPLEGVVYMAWGLAGVGAMIGLIRLNALGSSPVARALGFLPLLGFAAAALASALILAGLIPLEPVGIALSAIAWLSVLGGMLVVGIVAIAAKAWRGWRRFMPLLTVVMYLVGEGIGSALGIGSVIGDLAWVLLGYVIATGEPARKLQPSPAV